MRPVLAVLAMLATLAVADARWQMADVDHSGVVDCVDAQLVLEYVVMLDATKLDTTLADVSQNGQVTAYDVALIQQIAGGCDEEPTGMRPLTWADVKRLAAR